MFVFEVNFRAIFLILSLFVWQGTRWYTGFTIDFSEVGGREVQNGGA